MEAGYKTVVEEHLSQLRMGKTKCPKSQITSSVRDCSKHEFDSLDQLVNHVLPEAVCTMTSLVAEAGDNV